MKTLKELRKISSYLCLLLRHKPQAANLDIDTEGWVSVNQLLKNISSSKKTALTKSELMTIVEDDKKGRYSFKGHEQYIRCNQGHSIKSVKIKFEEYIPTEDIFHGTNPDLEDVILKEGLQSQNRNFVHLSKDIDTARTVGKRHSKNKKPIIFVVKKDAPIEFWITDNGVLQAKEVPPEYLTVFER